MTTSPFSPDDIRAAAEVHAELRADYHDAVVESSLAKVDREIDARVDARLAASRPTKRRGSSLIAAETHRGYLAGAVAGSYSGWEDRLWLIWVAIAVVYVAGATVATTRIRHRRQLARAMRSNNTRHVSPAHPGS